jgi:hypothetical protein
MRAFDYTLRLETSAILVQRVRRGQQSATQTPRA